MNALELALVLLTAAVLGVVAFRMLRLPPMLGYLAVGTLIGPHALGIAEETAATHLLAEIGVVFLMFSIGLEFSLPKLFAMRRAVFGLGTAQVLLTIGATMIVGALMATFLPQVVSIDWRTAFALGAALAMSSTAIVSKMLTERLELETPHGRQIIGILLFQDLAFVPLLILVPALATNQGDLLTTLALALMKAIVVLVLLLVVGQGLMRRWLHIVVKQRSHELFMLNLLLITLGAAWLTETAGLSLALGAFVAGMLISETEYRHQVEEEIRPFRDVLLGLFFISTGMLLNLGLVAEYWWAVFLLLTIPVLLKFALIALLARWFGAPTGTAIRTGLGLAQAGEFGIVLLHQAGGLQLVDPLLIQLILASMVLSMLFAPLIIAQSDAIAMKLSSNEWMTQSLALTEIASRTMATQGHVLIAGFGRSGQNLAKLLEEEGLHYHALDLDPDRVREAQAAGAAVSYGDATRRESLLAAGIHRAAAMVITFADTAAALRTLRLVQEVAPALSVIVRSHDDSDLDKLREAGADEVVPEAIEASLMLASHALITLGVPVRRVVHRVQAAREERYASLRGYFHGADDRADDAEHLHLRLHSVTLDPDAAAVGKTVSETGIEKVGAEVTSVRRSGQALDIATDPALQEGDVVVLRGTADGVARAEQHLLH